MIRKLKFLKKIKLLYNLRRFVYASNYFNNKYFQILKWTFTSNEDTNYTYRLTPDNQEYLAKIISYITQTKYEQIKGYLNELESDNKLIDHIQTQTKKSKLSRYADLDVRFGKRAGWYAFARALKPKLIVETGVDKGLGSIVLSAALLKNRSEGYIGEYIGTDINKEAGYLLNGEYLENCKILYGDSIKSLEKLNGKIDVFINDSDHSAEYEYQEYHTIKRLIDNNTVILGDNSHVTNKLLKFSIEENRDFLYFQVKPDNHWYPGGGIGISFKRDQTNGKATYKTS